ncbi:phosphotransferase [Desertibaculum subflavum]|uniref:phosphotransferase n=1 Tax=Desertibaculum subflavum TaxID=2268458 RepID=UPI000E6631D7
MIDDGFGSLSVEQRESIRAALSAAFGAAPIGVVGRMAGGATSAAIFRLRVGERDFVLRAEGAASPLRNPRQYLSMRIAAAAGVAPRLRHVDEVGRVAIMDYIAAKPLHTFPGGPRALAAALGALVARLQATPVFPHFVDYPDIVARLFAHVRRTGLFAAGLLDRHVERLEQIREAYAAGTTAPVSSHNDCNPRNILYDGARLWLIDWESAYRNDPLVDVAIMLDNLARTPDLEELLLQAWLGRAPEDALRERLKPVRALTRLYFAGVLLSASATGSRAAPDDDLSAPGVASFQSAIRDGRLKPGTLETKHVMGKMFLAAFLSGDLPPGLDTAIADD